ncbi:MAG: hypothetical protein U1F76_26900 [Candidatus Competibacteraceae bacterium]
MFTYGGGSQPVGITASDALSGLDSSGSLLTGSVNTNNAPGPVTINYTAKDKAGCALCAIDRYWV